jgi:hypothetical protein
MTFSTCYKSSFHRAVGFMCEKWNQYYELVKWKNLMFSSPSQTTYWNYSRHYTSIIITIINIWTLPWVRLNFFMSCILPTPCLKACYIKISLTKIKIKCIIFLSVWYYVDFRMHIFEELCCTCKILKVTVIKSPKPVNVMTLFIPQEL